MANILVTGAGSGFGKGTAIELAERGHTVTAATLLPVEAEAMAAAHDNISSMVLDVTSAADVATVAYLPIDVLVNNAGRGLMAPLTTVPLDEVRKTFDVNVFGMLAMSHHQRVVDRWRAVERNLRALRDDQACGRGPHHCDAR